MDKEQWLLDQYFREGIMLGQDLLLRHDAARRFVDDVERLGLTILGIHFFWEMPASEAKQFLAERRLPPYGIAMRPEGKVLIECNQYADFSQFRKLKDRAARSVATARQVLGTEFPEGTAWATIVLEPLKV